MIHQYKLNGYNIVLDIFSGAIHVVDDLAYDAIKYCDEAGAQSSAGIADKKSELAAKLRSKYITDRQEGSGSEDGPVTEQDISDILEDIAELADQKKLFTEDIFAGNAFDLKNRHQEIKALCLHVSHTCDLNCSYCFARQGNFAEQGNKSNTDASDKTSASDKISTSGKTDASGKADASELSNASEHPVLMSLQTGKDALDFLVANSGDRHNLEVDFFGGEPLLNWEVVKGIVEYGRSIEKKYDKNFRFTLTTNGMKIDDDVIDFTNREMHNLVLSLDGRKEVHDRFRKTPAGKGSYDTVVPKFKEFVKKRGGKDYYMRGTFTHHNTDFFEDIKHIADMGFTELSMEPVVAEPDSPEAIREEDLPVIFSQYEKLALEMLERKKQGKPFTFYHYMIDLGGGPCIYKRISGCGVGTEYYAVTPWGDLYPCHQFVNDPEYRMGSIYEGITEQEKIEEFRGCNSYSRQECIDCWARLYCSGGCAANAYHGTGSITGIYEMGCQMFRKRMECAIMLKLAEMDMDAEQM